MTKRDAIIALYRTGTAISKIIKSKYQNPQFMMRYKELGNTKNRPKSRGLRLFPTKSNIKAVREREKPP